MMANVAPANMAKEFRSMLMKVAQQLTEDEMIRLSYEEGFSVEPPPGSSGLQDIRINFLHKLEAKGVFSPKNPDGVTSLLKRLPREELIVEVNKYKEKYLSMKVTKKNKEKSKRKKSKDDGKKNPAEVKQLLSKTEITQDDIEDMFALAMTHASSLMDALDEVRELIQQPFPQEKLKIVAPQIKEAIVVLSKEDQLVMSICQEMKRLIAEVGSKKQQQSSEPIGNKGRKTPLPLPKTFAKKQFSTLPILSTADTQRPILTLPLPPTPDDDDDEEHFSEIKTMVTLGQGYDTYDQLPKRNRPLPLSPDVVQYCNVPPRQEEEGLYDVATEPLPQNGKQEQQPTYDDIVGTYDLDEGENCYDEIIEETELDENNYGVIRHSEIASGGTDQKPLPKLKSKPSPPKKLKAKQNSVEEELTENPMYMTTSPPEKGYMPLLKKHVVEDMYTDVKKP